MIENIIWQTTKGDYTKFELQYIQEYLFKDIQYNAIFDDNNCKTILDNSLIIYSCDEPELYQNLKEYFKNVYGNHPFMLVDDWDVAYNIIIELCQNFEKLEQYRLEIAEWYSIFKLELQNKIKSIIND